MRFVPLILPCFYVAPITALGDKRFCVAGNHRPSKHLWEGDRVSASSKATFALIVLFGINTMNFFDRQILGAVAEPVRKEFNLSDRDTGLLGTAFTLLYAFVGVPLGRLADTARRTWILAGGVFAWSVFTVASGAARTYWQLFALRLGVGIGEASCAPAATALIGDLFPPRRRARALSVFMLGLPIGIALSFLVSSWIAHSSDWRNAFYIAGVPGVIFAVAALFLDEPKRGSSEVQAIGAKRREGSPYLLVLSIPTMWWLILSGAFHNFNMYALGSFLSPMLQRYHGLDIRQAGIISMVAYGLSGIPGLFLGGAVADAVTGGNPRGKLLVGTFSILASVPLTYLALECAPGNTIRFAWLMAAGCAFMYVYYSTVYATIQDVVEPSLRGTAMALYFFAMYVMGASLGPFAMGFLSDYFALDAAANAGITGVIPRALDPIYRASGLHSAMYVVPVLGACLTVVLFAGSLTVGRDVEKLQRWIRESNES